eukprot:5987231-Pyramimonas_sp.AAC.1
MVLTSGQLSSARIGIHWKLEGACGRQRAGGGCSIHPRAPARICSASSWAIVNSKRLPVRTCLCCSSEHHGTPQM